VLFSALSHLFADTRHLTPETYFGLAPATIVILLFGTRIGMDFNRPYLP